MKAQLIDKKVLAEQVAELVRARLEDQLMDAIEEATIEVLENAGLPAIDDEDEMDLMFEIAERVTLTTV